jgi:two-component system phosphate regulon sensor histidine kinase PhoR
MHAFLRSWWRVVVDSNREANPTSIFRQARLAIYKLLGRVADARAGAAAAVTVSARRTTTTSADLGSLRAQSIVDALPDAALILDHEERVIAANGAAVNLLGPVRSGDRAVRSMRHPEFAEAIKTCLATGERATFLSTVGHPTERHLDGAASRLTGFSDAPGEPAVLVVLQDISEREALSRMRMEFVANASHELRTPLAALAGFIETLSGPAKDDPAARDRFLTIMAGQAQRMTRLIDDLLLLSRVEMRVHVAPTDKADLTMVVSEAITLTSAAARASHVTIKTQSKVSAAVLQGDHFELVQAVQNLLSNAIKYGRNGGQVVVSIERIDEPRGGAAYRLSVADDGPGIAAEHLPRLTERFYRVNTTTSRERGGTGLGLAIVKHIAVRHRGRVDVQSVVGQGTTVSLILPVHAPS